MIKKLKSEIVKSIKNKRINVFFLFLLSAFIILIFTKLSKEYTNTVAFDVEKLNVPQENIILNDSIKINITLKTHGFKWLKYYLSKPKIKIDFAKDVYKKEGVFVWNKSKAYLNNTQFDKEVELLNISPDTLTFRYGINLVKKVPVKVNAKVNFNPGYNTAGELVSNPDSIVIVGPNVIVSEIDFLETEDVVFDDVKSDLSEITKLKLPQNTSDLKFSNNEVLVEAKVEKFTEGTLKIPVTIINQPKQMELKYFPKTVNVSYYVSLNDYNSITNKNFKVICDYSKITENQSFLIPEFAKVPENVKNPKISQQRIEFILTK
ncbi:YbbR-like domain-containing protein [Flaviramulus sp. BrNp1-15]|uniref:YbbR-like domain-containing protein n=1 Tax=Flaviramulus sp. BrNp1-15 TaxID=2916754 RepID=UPI001EE78EF7|nr:YbbR-like domain-containing protein [Flaviramulus sp. BrNp1-15]ULC60644.1 YbbR-like domain-containing protein [Flaviramulus sp. BrNp1-15]